MNTEEKIKLSKDVAIISGIFCAFIAILLILNFMQMSRNEPLESEVMKTLVDRLSSEPDNEELKNDIRNLDLLARKAYFTSQWQVKTGALILLFGSIVFAIAIWFKRKLLTKIEKPLLPEYAELPARQITLRWLLISGGLLLISALAASFFSIDYLKDYAPQTQHAIESVTEKVETITISKSESPIIPISDDNANSNVLSEDPNLLVSEAVVTPANAPPLELSLEVLNKQHNSFRGPLGHGISYRKNIPIDWDVSTGRNIIWKTQVNKPGYNSPVIWGNKIFLSGADDESRVVYCFDINTGKLLWEREATGITGSPSKLPDVTDDTGLAAPSLTIDGNAVYAIFGTGDLIAFDLDGNQLWARNLGVPDNHYGHSSSLLVWENKLIVQYDTNMGGRLLAINTVNGESVWDVRRKNRISWASPILIPIEGKYQIVTSSEPTVAAHDPETGEVLWSLDCMMGEVGPSPAFSDGIVFAANEYARLLAIKPGEPAVILWEDNEYLPEASSPVVFRNLLYLATSYGVIACYDATTGEKYWEHDAGKGFYSSPMVVDGKVYVSDLGGLMYIFKASEEKVLLGTPALGENTYATPAFTDGKIYIRGEKNLYCIGVK